MKLHCKVDRNMRHVPERIRVSNLWEKLCHCLWIHEIRPLNLNLDSHSLITQFTSRSIRSNCQSLQCCNWGHLDKVDQLNYGQLMTIYTKKVGCGPMSGAYETRALFSGFRRSRLWVVIGLFRSMLLISLRGTELWVTINFLGMYCYFPVIQLVNFVFYHFTSDLISSSSPVFIVKYILFFSFLFINCPRSSEVDSRYSYHTNDHRIPWLSEPTLIPQRISHLLVVLLYQILSHASKDQIKPWAPTNRIWL